MKQRRSERCAQYNLEELSDNDFKDFCIEFSKTGFEQLDIAFKTACNGVDVLFPKEFCGSQMTNDQIKVFLECGHNYRQSNKLFISDAFESKDPKEYFKMLIELFDIPMLIDENKNYVRYLGAKILNPSYIEVGANEKYIRFYLYNTITPPKEMMVCKNASAPYYDPQDPPVSFPDIPSIKGETVIDHDGDPKPSQMYVKYRR